MKIYKVIHKSIFVDEGEDYVRTDVFIDKDLAYKYFKHEVENLRR